MKRKPLHERWLAARNAMRTLPPAGTAPTAAETGTIPMQPYVPIKPIAPAVPGVPTTPTTPNADVYTKVVPMLLGRKKAPTKPNGGSPLWSMYGNVQKD